MRGDHWPATGLTDRDRERFLGMGLAAICVSIHLRVLTTLERIEAQWYLEERLAAWTLPETPYEAALRALCVAAVAEAEEENGRECVESYGAPESQRGGA